MVNMARIFCAEQINVPSDLPDILKALMRGIFKVTALAGDAELAKDNSV